MMMSALKSEIIFPSENSIPPEFEFGNSIEQREYLIDGEILEWNGDVQDVFSPVYIRENGKLVQKRLGSQPVLNREAAFKALDAAVESYANGRGEWAIMNVKNRIDHLIQFARRMKEKRNEVV